MLCTLCFLFNSSMRFYSLLIACVLFFFLSSFVCKLQINLDYLFPSFKFSIIYRGNILFVRNWAWFNRSNGQSRLLHTISFIINEREKKIVQMILNSFSEFIFFFSFHLTSIERILVSYFLSIFFSTIFIFHFESLELIQLMTE